MTWSDDGRGSKVSLGGLGKKHLVEDEIGNCIPETRILCFQFFQVLHLVALQVVVFRASSVVCNFRYAYRPDRFFLRIQHVKLTKICDDLFPLWLRSHFNVLLRLIIYFAKDNLSG